MGNESLPSTCHYSITTRLHNINIAIRNTDIESVKPDRAREFFFSVFGFSFVDNTLKDIFMIFFITS